MRKRLSHTIILAAVVLWCTLLGATANAQILNVPQENQLCGNWCWAASSKAILDFKGIMIGSTPIEQCDIVNLCQGPHGWGTGDCCLPTPLSPACGSNCNHGNWLYSGPYSCRDVLANIGDFPLLYVGQNSAMTRAQITDQIAMLNTCMIRYDWWSGGAHALVLHGFVASTDMVYIMDPWPAHGKFFGTYPWVVSGSSSSYPGHTWTRTLRGPAPPIAPKAADVVFMVDRTGSASGEQAKYETFIGRIVDVFNAFNPNSRYALTYFMDFPLPGPIWDYGDPMWGDIAYDVETDFVGPAAVKAAFGAMPAGGGCDTPESQYTALYQAIMGTGLDLNSDGYNYLQGDLTPQPLSYTNPLKAYFMFTTPRQFHDSDTDANYPIPHSLGTPFNEPADYACSRMLTINAIQVLRGVGILFGVSIVTKGDSSNDPATDEKIANPQSGYDQPLTSGDDRIDPLLELVQISGGAILELTDENLDSLALLAYEMYMDSLAIPAQPMAVRIEKTHNTYQGCYEYVSITTSSRIFEMGGFDFLIAYDASALTCMEATPGQLLEDCGWEYFSYRHSWLSNCDGPCPSGLLRIIAYAEINNGPNHPSCFGPPDTDPHELAEMKFYVTNDRTFNCQYVPIRFFWHDCGDNAISNVAGNELYISYRVYNHEMIDITGTVHYGGHWWLGDCANPDTTKPSPIPDIDFIHGGIDIICADSIDAPGDINLNDIANEIADAVLFSNYFIFGLGVFDINPQGQIAATDVNQDGRVLTIGDLVYLTRIITGDALPFARLSPFTNAASVNMTVTHSAIEISTDSEVEIGACNLVFNYNGYDIGKPYLADGASGMTLKYNDEDGVLSVLVHSFEKGVSIGAGSESVLVIPISGEGSVELQHSEFSDYHGNLLTVDKGEKPIRPKSYALHQNYPNPFNATTSIIFELPKNAHVKIEVFNMMGQLVTTLFDADEVAGVHTVKWNAQNSSGDRVASGVYLYRITSEDYIDEKKMVLLK